MGGLVLSETNQFPKLETSRPWVVILLLGKNEQYKHNIYLKEEKNNIKRSSLLIWHGLYALLVAACTKFCAFVQGKILKELFLRG